VVDVRAGGNLRERLERHVQPVARAVRARRDEHVAAAERAAVDAGQCERDALACLCALDRAVVHLHASHAHREGCGLGAELVALADRAGPERAGDDRADPA